MKIYFNIYARNYQAQPSSCVLDGCITPNPLDCLIQVKLVSSELLEFYDNYL